MMVGRGHGVPGQADRHDRQAREDQGELLGAPAAEFALGLGLLSTGGPAQRLRLVPAFPVLRTR
jgi:hypothetical protein